MSAAAVVGTIDSLRSPVREQARAALDAFESAMSIRDVHHEVKQRSDGVYLSLLT